MPEDRVLIRIVTAANMAGVKEAEAGFLGMNPLILAAGVGLAGLVMAGKSAMEIAQAQAAAELQLANALKDRNAMAGKIIPISESAQASITKATLDHTKAVKELALLEQGHYIPATHLTQLELMRLQDAEARVTNATGQHRVTALRRLAELQVEYGAKVHGASTKVGSLAAAQQRVADTAKHLALLQGTVGATIRMTGIDAAAVRSELAAFIQTNREYITSQEDVVIATTSLVREGIPLKNLQRDQTLIMDLAASKNITLADATALVTKAEAGNFKGLKDLLGLTTPTVKATDSLAQKNKIVQQVMDTAAGKVKNASHAISDQKKAMNSLGNDWHDFAVGPGDEANRALTNLYQILDLTYQFLAKGGLQNEIIGLTGDLIAMIPGVQGLVDLYGLLVAGPKIAQAIQDSLHAGDSGGNFSGAAHNRGKKTPTTQHAQAAIHLHGPVTIVHKDAHTKQQMDDIRRVNRSFS